MVVASKLAANPGQAKFDTDDYSEGAPASGT